MIRFIVRRKILDAHSGGLQESMLTIDADVPALEQFLTSGGCGPSGYNIPELIGAEVLPDAMLAERAKP